MFESEKSIYIIITFMKRTEKSLLYSQIEQFQN